MNELEQYQENVFERIKHVDEFGSEYWLARELQRVLEYKEWRLFFDVIRKSQIACLESQNSIEDHFGVYNKMVSIGSGAKRKQVDYKLSRYACYLIVQNANPRYKTVALGQTYFAIQTRKQEISTKNYENMTETEKRFLTKEGNYSLNQVAKKCGVRNFDKFHNAGYKGLYNGETANDIAKRKGLRYREDILDNIGSEELAANLFRITQTESKLKRENIQGETKANSAHFEVGNIVRKAIIEAGGTLPEKFPTPKKSLKELKKEQLKEIKGGCAFLLA